MDVYMTIYDNTREKREVMARGRGINMQYTVKNSVVIGAIGDVGCFSSSVKHVYLYVYGGYIYVYLCISMYILPLHDPCASSPSVVRTPS